MTSGKYVKHMKSYEVIQVGLSFSPRIAWSHFLKQLTKCLMCHFASRMSSCFISQSLPAVQLSSL
jgi:hypothetical protein